jgi:nitroreductase
MDVKEAIRDRRAYRSLEKIEITKDFIKDLAETARIAPSCNNNQPWRFIFVYDQEQLNKLFTALTSTNKWVEKASMIIAVFSTSQNDCIINERMYFLFDTGLATAFIILRATELGFVAHPIAGYNEDKAKEILKIPKDIRLITLVIVGKHSSEINPDLSELMKLGEKNRPPRKMIKEIAFQNYYNNVLDV